MAEAFVKTFKRNYVSVNERIRTTDDVPQGLEGMSKSGHPLSGAEES